MDKSCHVLLEEEYARLTFDVVFIMHCWNSVPVIRENMIGQCGK